MGRRCQAGMPRQLRLALRKAMDSPMPAQPRRPLSSPGMGPMTLRRMYDLQCRSYGMKGCTPQPACYSDCGLRGF